MINRRPRSDYPVPWPREVVPSAATFIHFEIVDAESRDAQWKAMSRLMPKPSPADEEAIARIERAQTPAELVALAHEALGTARWVWQRRVEELGPEVLPLISSRLQTIDTVRAGDVRVTVLEALIEALRWQGEAGARVLMERFNDLGDYGRSLASVVLGLLGARGAADRIWAYYQRVVHIPGKSYFVGALWGLIDLEDARAADALLELLLRRRYFFELFGFVSLAGDKRTTVPLIMAATLGLEQYRESAQWALVSVAHRIGREAVLAEVRRAWPADVPEPTEELIDGFLNLPAAEAKEYFGVFYRGFQASDLEMLLQDS